MYFAPGRSPPISGSFSEFRCKNFLGHRFGPYRCRNPAAITVEIVPDTRQVIVLHRTGHSGLFKQLSPVLSPHQHEV